MGSQLSKRSDIIWKVRRIQGMTNFRNSAGIQSRKSSLDVSRVQDGGKKKQVGTSSEYKSGKHVGKSAEYNIDKKVGKYIIEETSREVNRVHGRKKTSLVGGGEGGGLTNKRP